MYGLTVKSQHDYSPDGSVEAFRENGFTRVPGLLTDEEVARYRTAALDAVGRDGVRRGPGSGHMISTADAWWNHDDLRRLACHPRIGSIAEELAGSPLRIWGGEVLLKQPQDSGPTIWHDDLTFALLDSRLTFNVWIALVDVPVDRGCLTFLPRSHRRREPQRVTLSAALDNPGTYLFDQWPELVWSPRVTVPVRAGDGTFHQSRTAHMAGGNDSDEIRLSFLITYTDVDAVYQAPPGNNPMEQADLIPGQPLPDDRFPRVRDVAGAPPGA
ncbi:MAG TPA: phytanoyl-CoA dioxygenase family protein [Nonomuraea sp.]|nr:phytanoyl-CoA dioxygenase family protein [Nonomuraea sp.]